MYFLQKAVTFLFDFARFVQKFALTYQEEIEYLRSYCNLIELSNGKNRIVVAPLLQGRVLTSCFSPDQPGLGWVNHQLILSGENQPHINTFGGEDRIWLGPEAGQYGIFFKPGQSFTQLNWQTPACVDSESFELVAQSAQKVHLKKNASLMNYQGVQFDCCIDRIISILPENFLASQGIYLKESTYSFVGFESHNRLENTAERPWNYASGLLNLWVLGQYKCSSKTWSIIPHRTNASINTNYFKADLENRLIQSENFSLLKVDGLKKSKIGIRPENDLGVIGSFDFEQLMLTVVQYETERKEHFLNSEWCIQDDPYSGDALNVYNDGPDENGIVLGPYYELESSSSSKELQQGECIELIHRTLHFSGEFETLREIAKNLLFVDLNDVKRIIHGK